MAVKRKRGVQGTRSRRELDDLLEAASEFDWLRALHAATCFFREARGDSVAEIAEDMQREVTRSERLRTMLEKAFGEKTR